MWVENRFGSLKVGSIGGGYKCICGGDKGVLGLRILLHLYFIRCSIFTILLCLLFL